MANFNGLVRQDSAPAFGAAAAGFALDQFGRRTGNLPAATTLSRPQWLYTAGVAGVGALIQGFLPRYDGFGQGMVAGAAYATGVGLSALVGGSKATSTSRVQGRPSNVIPLQRVAGGRVSPPSI